VHSLLFIEDDDQIRLALRLALEDEGYEVREAADGASGLASFHQSEPDLVLLDLRLPDISGFEVCRAMRAMSIVPIVMVTAETDTSDMVSGLEAGADDYVTKPVVPKELAARVRAHLRRARLQGTMVTSTSETFGDVDLRREQGQVFKAGREVALEDLLSLRMTSYVLDPVRLPPDMIRDLHRLALGGPRTLADLMSAAGGEGRARLRAVLWLAKLGLLELAPPA